jgi:hypothetical protein
MVIIKFIVVAMVFIAMTPDKTKKNEKGNYSNDDVNFM